MIVLRHPLLVRVVLLIVCVALAFGVISRPHHGGTVVILVLLAILTVAVFAYRIEISRSGIRVRYMPFYERRIRLEDVQHFVEEKTLVLITARGRVPLWNLPLRRREELFEILPIHLQIAPQPNSERGPRESLRIHFRRVILLGSCLAGALILLVPFLNDYPLNRYWDTVGKYVLVVCMVLFVLLAFEAVTTSVYWEYLRDIERFEKQKK
jgi:hypothetical protein